MEDEVNVEAVDPETVPDEATDEPEPTIADEVDQSVHEALVTDESVAESVETDEAARRAGIRANMAANMRKKCK